jgi:hypothetical protein
VNLWKYDTKSPLSGVVFCSVVSTGVTWGPWGDKVSYGDKGTTVSGVANDDLEVDADVSIESIDECETGWWFIMSPLVGLFPAALQYLRFEFWFLKADAV